MISIADKLSARSEVVVCGGRIELFAGCAVTELEVHVHSSGRTFSISVDAAATLVLEVPEDAVAGSFVTIADLSGDSPDTVLVEVVAP